MTGEEHSRITSFIWGTADLIRDTFKRGKYQDVILPFTVLRRLDCVLEPTHEKVQADYRRYKDELGSLDNLLCGVTGHAFYNVSPFTFERLLQDSTHLETNLTTWLNGFSENMRQVLEKFDFPSTLAKLAERGLLYKVLERFSQIDLHPDRVTNHAMGSIFEELLRKFNEATNENPGEHFTPRDVVELMAHLMLDPDRQGLSEPGKVIEIYDPCSGTGGMLTVTRDLVLQLNPSAGVYLYGQEVNPETWAICKSDLYLKTETGKDAESIAYGSTLADDRHAGKRFDYLIANPPYGKDWKLDREAVEDEHENLGFDGRFGPGTPRISDGQTLFLLHMVHHMQSPEKEGSRVAIVMNGSPLFTGDAGSGESEIRRWLLEQDLVEAIVALPEQLFYNTGIATYVWVLTNRKAPERRGKVQLLDASGQNFWKPMRKSLGDKRRQIGEPHAAAILELYRRFEETEHSKIFPASAFGCRKVRVEQPLRLSFRFSEDRIARLEEERAFRNLATSRKKKKETRQQEIAEGRSRQEEIRRVLEEAAARDDRVYQGREEFRHALKQVFEDQDIQLTAPLRKAIESALGERDETAEICRKKGEPEPDPALRDYETVPLEEDIYDYFEREVKPHVPDAWIDENYTDERDRGVGRVGYEINFNRHFYVYEPPRPLPEIEADIRELGQEIVGLLNEMTAGRGETL
jgi:type I restriction enzyme M protein